MARQIYIYILLSVLLFSLHIPLWCLEPDKTISQYILDTWTTENGLPSDSVITITQTKNGYLWIGTTKGLVRYDGIDFKKILFTGDEAIDSQDIFALFADRNGIIWAGTAVGLIRYDYNRHQVKFFKAEDGISPGGVRCITRDSKNNVWIGFEVEYANRLAGGTFFRFNDSHGLSGKKVNSIYENHQGQLLFLTRSHGIFRYENNTFKPYEIPGLIPSSLINMREDRHSRLWIQGLNGLFQTKIMNRNAAQGKYIFTCEEPQLTSFTIDSHDNIWIGMQSGLKRMIMNSDGSIRTDSFLEDQRIYCLFEDREKNLWIGLDNGGLWRLRDGAFSPYVPFEALTKETPVSLYRDRNGDTWIGALSGRLFRCRADQILETIDVPAPPGASITAITADSEGNLWLGTTNSGVLKREGKMFTRYTIKEGLKDNSVTSIYRDHSGRLWFSTYGGVSVRDSQNSPIRPLHLDLPGKVVNNVIQDRSGAIWIATKQGIAQLNQKEKVIKKYLVGIPVCCIYETSSSKADNRLLWITTVGHGLKRLSLPDGNIVTFSTTSGMTTNYMYQMLADSHGNFWLTSKSGVLRVSKNELNAAAENSVDEINCVDFGLHDGLKSLEFDNPFSVHSVLDNNGEFWFITGKGISIVSPGRTELNQIPPPVVIEEIRVNLQPYQFSHDNGLISLKGVAHLSFHFTAPTFIAPDKTKFRYRLSGINRDWVYLLPGQERAAHFKDLSPGKFTFEVSACNSEGEWRQLSGDSIDIRILPLYYQTLWFKLIMVLLFAALAAVLLWLSKKKKKTPEKQTKYKSSSLTPEFADECLTKLRYLMEVEKIFCDADLSLQMLADKISTQPWVLSQLLNEKIERNFADYINRYRVDEAKRVLLSPAGSRRKIYAIATSSGFNTMAAFYKAFKKYTGMTPTQFKKKSKKDPNSSGKQ